MRTCCSYHFEGRDLVDLRGLIVTSYIAALDAFGQCRLFRKVNAENSKLVVSNRRAVLEQEMKELSRGDVVEG